MLHIFCLTRKHVTGQLASVLRFSIALHSMKNIFGKGAPAAPSTHQPPAAATTTTQQQPDDSKTQQALAAKKKHDEMRKKMEALYLKVSEQPQHIQEMDPANLSKPSVFILKRDLDSDVYLHDIKKYYYEEIEILPKRKEIFEKCDLFEGVPPEFVPKDESEELLTEEYQQEEAHVDKETGEMFSIMVNKKRYKIKNTGIRDTFMKNVRKNRFTYVKPTFTEASMASLVEPELAEFCKRVIPAPKQAPHPNEGMFKGAGDKAGVQVWHVSQMHAKLVTSQQGSFYDSDCYIILFTAKAQDLELATRKMHMWFGHNSSMKKRAICAYLCFELTNILRESKYKASHYHEEQGEEREEFVKYFKSINILQGSGSKSEDTLRAVKEDARMPRLIRVAFDGSKLVAKQVPMVSKDVFTGQLGKDAEVFVHAAASGVLYVWMGKDSLQGNRIKAQDIVSMIRTEEYKGRNTSILYVYQGEEPEAFWTDFTATTTTTTAPELSLEVTAPNMAYLYELEVQEKTGTSLIKRVDLKKSSLNTKLVYLLETRFDLYIWCGIASDTMERRYAKTLAQILKKKNPELKVYTFFEGYEPVLFQERFPRGFYFVETPVTYEKRRLELSTISKFKPNVDIEGRFDPEEAEPVTYADPKDDGSGAYRVFRVINSSEAEAIPEEQIGHFYLGDCYLVIYEFNRNLQEEEEDEEDEEEEKPEFKDQGNDIVKSKDAKKKKINYLPQRYVFAWEGSDSDEKIATRILKKNFRGYLTRKKNPARLINLESSKEDEHFMKIFQHSLVLHPGKSTDPVTGFEATRDKPTMYRIHCKSKINARAVEIPRKKSHLNSNDIFLIIKGDNAWLWSGQFTGDAKKKIAVQFVKELASDKEVTAIDESEEPEDFWDDIEDQDASYFEEQLKYSAGDVYELFITANFYRVVHVGEVGKTFTQDDLLACANIMLFDFMYTVFIYYPREPKDAERQLAVRAVHTLTKDDDKKKPDNAPVEMYRNKESIGFKQAFTEPWRTPKAYVDKFAIARVEAEKKRSQTICKLLPFLREMRLQYNHFLCDDEGVNIENLLFMVELCKANKTVAALLKELKKYKKQFNEDFAASLLEFVNKHVQ